MRILILGSSGLLGSTLLPHLKKRGHDVQGCSRTGNTEFNFDLTNTDVVHNALTKADPEIIINLAALTNVDECQQFPQLSYLSNVKIVENVAKWIQHKNNLCHLIQISTDHIYDGHGPQKEENITLKNYYAFSKYTGELAALTVSSTILRTNFFGVSQCPSKMSFSDWIVQSLIQNAPITVYEDVLFSPLSINSLVELLELVMMKRQKGIFNLGTKEGMSKADFAFMLADALNLKTTSMLRGPSNPTANKVARPKDMRMDSSKFEKFFDVKLPTLKTEILSMKGLYVFDKKSNS